MPKATLEFNLPEEREEYELAMEGAKNAIYVEDIWNECFRPAFKHGYKDENINALLEKLGPEGYDLISALANIYQAILDEEN